MTNRAELRRLCEAAISPMYIGDREAQAQEHIRARSAFEAMAKPAVVLLLLDECDKAESERDAALAELEACRKDAERYRRLRAAAVRDHGIAPEKFDAEFDASLKAIDAAMSQEAPNA